MINLGIENFENLPQMETNGQVIIRFEAISIKYRLEGIGS